MLTFLHENFEPMRIHLGPRYLKTLPYKLGRREYKLMPPTVKSSCVLTFSTLNKIASLAGRGIHVFLSDHCEYSVQNQ
jgi:hypothetical protein